MKYYITRARIIEPGDMEHSDYFMLTSKKKKPHWSKSVAIPEHELHWIFSTLHEYESAQRRLRDLYYKETPAAETVDG